MTEVAQKNIFGPSAIISAKMRSRMSTRFPSVQNLPVSKVNEKTRLHLHAPPFPEKPEMPDTRSNYCRSSTAMAMSYPKAVAADGKEQRRRIHIRPSMREILWAKIGNSAARKIRFSHQLYHLAV
jgi:hypothetical protein